MNKPNNTPIWERIQFLLLETMAGTTVAILTVNSSVSIIHVTILVTSLMLTGAGWIGLANLSENLRIEEQGTRNKKKSSPAK